MHSKQQIYDFIATKPFMVISTVSHSGAPESAVVGFGQTKNFQLIFGTTSDTRKAQNIQQNDKVSVVIGWDESGTVQYNGRARQLSSEETDYYAEIYFMKNPAARRHKDNPSERYFLVEPAWLRFTEIEPHPRKMTELYFVKGN